MSKEKHFYTEGQSFHYVFFLFFFVSRLRLFSGVKLVFCVSDVTR